MAAFREGRVVDVTERTERLVRARVEMPDGEIEASGFPSMLGPLNRGDRVVVNVTGLELGLGTGGDGFLLWNLDGPGGVDRGGGHIMKMRYTPWQTEILAAEAPESPHHAALQRVTSLQGMPVVACGLHSQIAGVAAGIKERHPRAVIGYVMTDAGALPLAWSRLVSSLQRSELIDVTCTVGHSFGGDLEAVNVFSGLAAVRMVGGADAAIVSMGPGVVGTGTALGFSAIEQGQVLDAAGALGGNAIASLRLSFADPRDRHQGISHHTITALTLAAQRRATVAVPELPRSRSEQINAQLRDEGITERHSIMEADGRPGLRLLERTGIQVDSMGRSMAEAPEGSLAAAAAGAVAAQMADAR